MYYAIGDIHGMLGHLEQMLAKIYERKPGTIIFIGDYIDRGPDSKGVLDLIMKGPKEGFEFITLMGNHEDMLLDTYNSKNPENRHHWLSNGGQYTLQSFGLNPYEDRMPEKYVDWMKSHLWLQYETPEYFFVHAGVRPGVALIDQNRFDKLWIRYDFLTSKYNWGKRIIHGHTPTLPPEVTPNRINLDTGAVFYGFMRCAVLDGDKEPEFIDIKGKAAPQYIKPDLPWSN